jgi:hypothetical protein
MDAPASGTRSPRDTALDFFGQCKEGLGFGKHVVYVTLRDTMIDEGEEANLLSCGAEFGRDGIDAIFEVGEGDLSWK